jgi:hypothetical protein
VSSFSADGEPVAKPAHLCVCSVCRSHTGYYSNGPLFFFFVLLLFLQSQSLHCLEGRPKSSQTGSFPVLFPSTSNNSLQNVTPHHHFLTNRVNTHNTNLLIFYAFIDTSFLLRILTREYGTDTLRNTLLDDSYGMIAIKHYEMIPITL